MRITAYKTQKITVGINLISILDTYLPSLEEKTIVVVTSKIISICEGNSIIDDGTVSKQDLAKREAEYYLDEKYPTPYGHVIAIKGGMLFPSAGIDESNSDGNFILWPNDPQQTAADIWKYLRDKHGVRELGVIITDSHTIPLCWGVSGIGIAWCGFKALKNYIGSPDIYGKPLQSTQAAIKDSIAVAAVIIMGEGAEQTPLAVVSDIPFVEFQDRPPTKEEMDNLHITLEEDIYGPLLTGVTWKKGKNKALIKSAS